MLAGEVGRGKSTKGLNYRILSSIPGLYPLMPVAPAPTILTTRNVSEFPRVSSNFPGEIGNHCLRQLPLFRRRIQTLLLEACLVGRVESLPGGCEQGLFFCSGRLFPGRGRGRREADHGEPRPREHSWVAAGPALCSWRQQGWAGLRGAWALWVRRRESIP